MTITEFLTARLDEDEAVAREADEVNRADWGEGAKWETSVGWDRDYGAMPEVSMSPERALADIAAKRAIVATLLDEGGERLFADIFRLLVQPYADHPDFDPTWR